MHLSVPPEGRRAHRELAPLDERPLVSDRQEDVGFAERIVVEEVSRVGEEVVRLDTPALHRDRHAELALLVALAVQRQELRVLRRRVGDEGPGERLERRGLIVLAPEGAQYPVKPRQQDGRTEPRVRRVLGELRPGSGIGARRPIG